MIHVAAGIADFLWLLIRAALSLAGQLLVGVVLLGGAVGLIAWAGKRRRKRN